MTKTIARITKYIAYAAAILILMSALAVSVARLMTPYLNEHLPDIEGWASQILQAPIKIKDAKITWDIYEPELTLEEVKVLQEKTLQPKITINKISVNLSLFRSLLARRLITETIKVTGVHLTLRESAGGAFSVDELKDLIVTDNASGSSVEVDDILEWIFSQASLIIRNVDITYFPLLNNKDATIKSELFSTALNANGALSIWIDNLRLKNSFSSHQLFGTLVLSEVAPLKARIRLEWNGNKLDPAVISGNAALYLENISLSHWLSEVAWQGLQVKQGVGSIKVSAEWDRNQWQKIKSQFQFYDLNIASATTHKNQAIPRFTGSVLWEQEDGKKTITGKNILLDLSDHLWPENQFSLSYSSASDGTVHLDNASISYVDLADAGRLALASGLLPATLQDEIKKINPQGELNHLKIYLTGAMDAAHIQLEMQFSELQTSPWQNFPGVDGLTGSVNWNGKEGTFILNATHAGLNYPSIFLTPLQFEQLSGKVHWYQDEKNIWQVNASGLRAANKDINLSADLNLNFPAAGLPNIKLSANFDLLNASQITHYLPLKVLEAELTDWLQHAFLGGRVESGKAVVEGNLADYPYESGNGTFTVGGVLKDVDFLYAAGWPAIQKANGRLAFSGVSMTVDIDSAELLGVPITSAKGVIPSLSASVPSILEVQASLSTDFSDAMHFINESPLRDTLGKDMAGLEVTGAMQLKLGLSVPLDKPFDTQVQGDVTVSDAELKLPQWNLELNKLNGTFQFTVDTLLGSNLQGYLLDEPVQLDFSTQKDKTTGYLAASLKGKFTVSALERWLKMPLDKFVQGNANYTAALQFAPHTSPRPTTVIIQSDLQGMTINMPAPYGKKAEDKQNASIALTVVAKQPLQTQITYGNDLSAALSFQQTQQEFKLLNGQILIGQGQASLPKQPGLTLAANFKTLNWEMLQPYIDWAKQNGSADDSYFNMIDVQAAQADLFGQHFDQARFQLSKTNNIWSIKINSTQVAGQVTLPADISSVQGDFQRFYASPSNGPQQTIDPKTLPPLTISANDVRYNKMQMGSVLLNTAPTASGLSIEKFTLTVPGATMEAVGSWQLAQGKYKTTFQGNLLATNITEALTQWGLSDAALIGKNATADFALSWADAPFSPSLATLSGTLSLNLGPGHIVDLGNSTNAKLGLGRLLNLLSLQSIPRRLSLNFSDLFEKGYSFDKMKADVNLQNGNAVTDNLRFDGPVARVEIAGRIGLAVKDYDVKLSVTPYVTSSLPVVATLAGGPLVGAATWLVDKVVSHQVSKVTTHEYKVTGTWDNPIWQEMGAQ